MDKAEAIERLGYQKARAQIALEQEVPEWIAEDLLGTIEAYDMAIEALQTEPKRGEWIDNRGASDKSQLFPFECSECHDVNERTTNFCPNCGADMREREGE